MIGQSCSIAVSKNLEFSATCSAPAASASGLPDTTDSLTTSPTRPPGYCI
jgi:hypothetical protein